MQTLSCLSQVSGNDKVWGHWLLCCLKALSISTGFGGYCGGIGVTCKHRVQRELSDLGTPPRVSVN